eukprot:1668009-Amphidinium_carterae.1
MLDIMLAACCCRAVHNSGSMHLYFLLSGGEMNPKGRRLRNVYLRCPKCCFFLSKLLRTQAALTLTDAAALLSFWLTFVLSWIRLPSATSLCLFLQFVKLTAHILPAHQDGMRWASCGEVVEHILPKAAADNARRGITGWMLYNDRTLSVYQ